MSVADVKKNVYDEDILAIVTEEAVRGDAGTTTGAGRNPPSVPIWTQSVLLMEPASRCSAPDAPTSRHARHLQRGDRLAPVAQEPHTHAAQFFESVASRR